MNVTTTSRRLWRWAKGKDPLCFEDVAVDREFLGSDYGGHCAYSRGFHADTVIYSIGVGEDASFDLALIERYGVQVHAFDPTPRSIAWVQQQNLPETFRFHPLGVAEFDGRAQFYPPVNPAHVSHTLNVREETAVGAVEVEVRTVSTLMSMLGHTRIDMLKLDIEGTEYPVLEQLLERDIQVDQLLVEYHHQFKQIPRSRTAKSIAALRRAGYRVFSISDTGREYSFLHTRLLSG